MSVEGKGMNIADVYQLKAKMNNAVSSYLQKNDTVQLKADGDVWKKKTEKDKQDITLALDQSNKVLSSGTKNGVKLSPEEMDKELDKENMLYDDLMRQRLGLG